LTSDPTSIGSKIIVNQQVDSSNHGCVVVSQPMFFPWYGFLEQVSLCDTFVFYDDVQFSKGSFTNRVQIKTINGTRWITVPTQNLHLGQRINEVQINQQKNWQRSIHDSLKQAYSNSPFKEDMLSLVDQVFAFEVDSLSELVMTSMQVLMDYLGLAKQVRFYKSSELGISGGSTQRVLDLCVHLKADSYLTGHGARHYLEHEFFESHGIPVDYINYGLNAYPQGHGVFTPYVSALDLVANCGKDGTKYIVGEAISWRKFTAKT
jgi:hypothetical protein